MSAPVPTPALLAAPTPSDAPAAAAPTALGVVGTGWRAEFFVRLARMAPDRLRVAALVTRTAERAREVALAQGVPVVTTMEEGLAHRPDAVVVSVPWPQTPQVVRELVARGVRVLAETPPAPDLDGLRALWADVGASGLVQVAEQYPRMPGHAARLALLAQGTIGRVTSAQVCSTHLYHAVALLRALLGVGSDDVVVSARAFSAPLVQPLSPSGWDAGAVPQPATTTLATLDFGDRHGLYDFTDNQWWNPLRARRLVVRGSTGELVDDAVTRMLDPLTPATSSLVHRRRGVDLDLEGVDLDAITFEGRVLHRSAWAGTRMSDDDAAVAQLLADTGAWARDEGPEPYPLADGCQDHAVALAVERSAATGQDVRVSGEPWAAAVR